MNRSSLLARFLFRWFVSSLGLWIAAGLLGGTIRFDGSGGVVITAGLLLAVVNTVIKPIIVFLTFPAILLTLGLFMIVINGLTVALVSHLYKPLHIEHFWAAMLAGMIIGLVNYLVVTILEEKNR